MRIATKLTLSLLLAVAVVMAGFGYLRAQQERQRLIDEAQQEALILTNAIKLTVEHALRDRRPQDIQELLAEMVRDPNSVDRIRILDDRLEDIISAVAGMAATMSAPQEERNQVLKSGKPLVRYLDDSARPSAYAIVPLKSRSGTTIGVVEVVQPATRVQRQIEDTIRDLVLRLSILSLTIALVIWVTVRISIRRPIGHLTRTALALGHGDLGRRLELKRRDEIGQLARAFDRMAENLQAAQSQIVTEAQARLELEQQVQQAQKLAAVGRLASEVAHEIGTPLGVISGRAETIQKKLEDGHPLSRHVVTILQQIERISATLRQLLHHARPRRPAACPVAAGQMLARIVELLQPMAARREIILRAQAANELAPLLADPDQLQQVLLNLVNNALEATPPGGRVHLTATQDDPTPIADQPNGQVRITRGHAEAPYLTLAVADTGCGMSDEQLEHVFEPFFSTKELRGGTGLGMAIVEDIVRAHRGAIEVRSAPGAGTTVLVRWPLAVG